MDAVARNHFSFEKHRKELEKKKKKEAKRQARTDRKAELEEGAEPVEPIIKVDEFGNVVEIWPEDLTDGEEATDEVEEEAEEKN